MKLDVLRTIVNAPWYIPNIILHTDLLIPTVREEITKHSIAHKAKLFQHTNQLIPIILEEHGPKWLKRFKPTDLTHSLITNNFTRKWNKVERVCWNTTPHVRSL